MHQEVDLFHKPQPIWAQFGRVRDGKSSDNSRYWPSSSSNPPKLPLPKKIFLSYRRDDSSDITGRIYDWLIQDFSKAQIMRDVDSIPLGINFKKYINEEVNKCHVLLAIIGEKWLSIAHPNGQRRLDDPADFVRIEIESALNREIALIPVLVHGIAAPKESELPDTLKQLAYMNGLSVRRDPDFKNDMDRLITALKEILK